MMWRPPIVPSDVETNARDPSVDEAKIDPDGTRLAAPATDLKTSNEASLLILGNKRKESGGALDGNQDDISPAKKKTKVTKDGEKPNSSSTTKKTLSKDRLTRAKKPKEMPRRPLSAYNIFFKTSREQMMASLKAQRGDGADSSGGKIGFATLAKTIGKKWKELGAEELEIYKLKAQEDTHRYKRQMEDYHQSLARKRKIILPPAPAFAWDHQGEEDTSDEEKPTALTDFPRQAVGVENPASMQSLRDSRHLIDVDELISLQRVRDSLVGESFDDRAMNYGRNLFTGSFDNVIPSRQIDSEELLQQYAQLKRQEAALREAAVAPYTESRASMLQEQSGSMYDRLLAHERLRSQHQLLMERSGLRYPQQRQQHHSPSYIQSLSQSLFELQQQQHHQQQLATQQQQLATQQRTSSLLEQLLQRQRHQEQTQLTPASLSSMPSADLISRHNNSRFQFPLSLSNHPTTRGRGGYAEEHNSSDDSR